MHSNVEISCQMSTVLSSGTNCVLNAKYVEGPMSGTGVEKRARKEGIASPRSSISDDVQIEDRSGHRLKPSALVLMAP